ncbi:MAG TPA: type IV pilus modification protein PilV [Gammaproteobacteria bacterium]|nr:type IV pilus modification protein PilV [Gammaproteobacteria bacterium]
MSLNRLESRGHRERGVSLLEVLVALLVMSVGLIGLAALQAKSMQANWEGVYGIRAVHLADQIIESMRANPAGATSYSGTGQNNGCSDAGTGGSTATDCSALQMAQDDMWHWNQAIGDQATGLPNGSGSVTQLASATPCAASTTRYQVAVTWQNSATPHSYSTYFCL